jgi:dTDP-4-amino-4,6-dideoxygalactose transaminase
MWVLADAAQSFGANYKGRKVGTFGLATATSFFPAKPLGCYGDGGAIFTDDAEMADILQSIRVHGKGSDKYDNVRIGLNARLDTLQAAILRVKLSIFADEIDARNRVAHGYHERLGNFNQLKLPRVMSDCQSVWAQFVIKVEAEKRQAIADSLKSEGIATAIYYPKPLHWQTAYKDFPISQAGVAVSEVLSQQVLALPMHPYLTGEDQDYICDAVKTSLSV